MTTKQTCFSLSLLFCLAVSSVEFARAAVPTRDVVFATIDGHELKLDLFLPEDAQHPPLVVFIHGGGWRNNSYKSCRTTWLTEHGFAVASIGYRLTDKAIFPAQIHDCKAAVRWLRAHADEYPYDASRIGVAGTSAGGHLSLLMGVTSGNEVFEGEVGGNLDQSSRVDAVVDYFGPSDFLMRSKNQPSKTEQPGSPVRLLLGGPASEKTDLARMASPAFQVTDQAPPLLIIHGDKDSTVRLAQSERMVDAYRVHKRDVTLEVVAGAGHGGGEHFNPARRKSVADFFDKHLRSDAP
jgi:acetyl esterase/lipase